MQIRLRVDGYLRDRETRQEFVHIESISLAKYPMQGDQERFQGLAFILTQLGTPVFKPSHLLLRYWIGGSRQIDLAVESATLWNEMQPFFMGWSPAATAFVHSEFSWQLGRPHDNPNFCEVCLGRICEQLGQPARVIAVMILHFNFLWASEHIDAPDIRFNCWDLVHQPLRFQYIRRNMQSNQPPNGELVVDRQHSLDSFRKFIHDMPAASRSVQPWGVRFQGELGRDAGALTIDFCMEVAVAFFASPLLVQIGDYYQPSGDDQDFVLVGNLLSILLRLKIQVGFPLMDFCWRLICGEEVEFDCQERDAVRNAMERVRKGFFDNSGLPPGFRLPWADLRAMVEGEPVTAKKLLALMTFTGSGKQEQVHMFEREFLDFDAPTATEFLRFATARARIPVGSQSTDSSRPNFFCITIQVTENEGALFVAHACENTVKMGIYESQEELREKLLRSMRESGGFGLV
jgi:hypothetical protein